MTTKCKAMTDEEINEILFNEKENRKRQDEINKLLQNPKKSLNNKIKEFFNKRNE